MIDKKKIKKALPPQTPREIPDVKQKLPTSC
jgi:hypothetical protein